MLDAGEEINSDSSSGFLYSTKTFIQIGITVFRKFANNKERAKLLSDYINQYLNFSIIKDILIEEHKSRDNNADTLLDDSDFEQLKKILFLN